MLFFILLNMENLPKLLESKAKIRFQDCDPFNHLNNGSYINYMINAREDQVLEAYNFDIHALMKKHQQSWVTASNQIAYLKPAFLSEKVAIDSKIIRLSERDMTVEIRMWNENKSQLKTVLWCGFVYFDLKTQRVAKHPKEFMELFEKVMHPLTDRLFESRVQTLKKENIKIQ